jgi:hypothetical protein
MFLDTDNITQWNQRENVHITDNNKYSHTIELEICTINIFLSCLPFENQI